MYRAHGFEFVTGFFWISFILTYAILSLNRDRRKCSKRLKPLRTPKSLATLSHSPTSSHTQAVVRAVFNNASDHSGKPCVYKCVYNVRMYTMS